MDVIKKYNVMKITKRITFDVEKCIEEYTISNYDAIDDNEVFEKYAIDAIKAGVNLFKYKKQTDQVRINKLQEDLVYFIPRETTWRFNEENTNIEGTMVDRINPILDTQIANRNNITSYSSSNAGSQEVSEKLWNRIRTTIRNGGFN